MESSRLTAITEELQRERLEETAKVDALTAELLECESKRDLLDSVLLALSGNALKDADKLFPPKGRKKPQGKSPKKSDVIRAMNVVLSREESLVIERLKSLVEAELTKDGFNRTGFAMRLKEACKDSSFIETKEGYRLSEEVRLAGISSQGSSETCHPSRIRPEATFVAKGNDSAGISSSDWTARMSILR